MAYIFFLFFIRFITLFNQWEVRSRLLQYVNSLTARKDDQDRISIIVCVSLSEVT